VADFNELSHNLHGSNYYNDEVYVRQDYHVTGRVILGLFNDTFYTFKWHDVCQL